MKRLGWILAFICTVLCCTLPASAQIGTVPSDQIPVKTNGPLLVTGYSFSGHSVRYVQIYNNSSSVVSLNDWNVAYDYAGSTATILELYGSIAPKQYVTASEASVIPTATFTFIDSEVPIDPALHSIRLVPPNSLNFNDEVATPSITSSTVRLTGTPATFHFARTVSASTGNYNSTFSAFIPDDTFSLASDSLYEPPSVAGVSIVEVYPDAPNCSPVSDGVCTDYIKLFNGTGDTIDLSTLRLRTGSYGQSVTSSNTIHLSGALPSGQYASFPITLSSSGSWVWLEDTYGTVRYDATLVEYPSSAGHDGEAWSYNSGKQMWVWTAYPQPGNVENQFASPVVANYCNGIILNEVAANVATEDQFVEIKNTSTASVLLDGCMLQTNRSTTKSYALSGYLSAGELRVIYIKDTPLTLTKTTSGAVYLLSSDLSVEVGAINYDDPSIDTSLSLIGSSWLETYAITPGSVNVWQEFPPCQDGYYRNTDTGHCNKIQVATALADCGVGKYRSPDTNRCRNTTSTTSTLVPCAVNQVRNPATNRCRAVSAASSLKQCAANQERNPATNRCRNKAQLIQADFPVEAVGESAQATLGWWAFGGVGLLALGYAGWEWRYEVLTAIKKAMTFLPSRE